VLELCGSGGVLMEELVLIVCTGRRISRVYPGGLTALILAVPASVFFGYWVCLIRQEIDG
jgi:hypothetical protein